LLPKADFSVKNKENGEMSEGMRLPLSLQPHAQQVSKPEKPRKTSKILPWGAKIVWRAPKTLGLPTDMTKTEKEARARVFFQVSAIAGNA